MPADQLSDEQILHRWDTHVALNQPNLHDTDKLAFARAVLYDEAARRAAASPAPTAEPAPEPVYWQWRRKGQPWTLAQTFNTSVFATSDDSEVRPLFAAPVAAAPMPPQPLTEDEVLAAIQSCGAELQGRISLTYESGPYDVTKPTHVAMKLARAIQQAVGDQGEKR